VQLEAGVVVLDATTPDKPSAKKMELATRHWSGKHYGVVQGINWLTLLWSSFPNSAIMFSKAPSRLPDLPKV
jgi:hypothetical protein